MLGQVKVAMPGKLGRGAYISPKELMARWRCSRASVDRIARRAGISRVCLGAGRNGMVRYLLGQVMDFEASRRVEATPVSGRRL